MRFTFALLLLFTSCAFADDFDDINKTDTDAATGQTAAKSPPFAIKSQGWANVAAGESFVSEGVASPGVHSILSKEWNQDVTLHSEAGFVSASGWGGQLIYDRLPGMGYTPSSGALTTLSAEGLYRLHLSENLFFGFSGGLVQTQNPVVGISSADTIDTETQTSTSAIVGASLGWGNERWSNMVGVHYGGFNVQDNNMFSAEISSGFNVTKDFVLGMRFASQSHELSPAGPLGWRTSVSSEDFQVQAGVKF